MIAKSQEDGVLRSRLTSWGEDEIFEKEKVLYTDFQKDEAPNDTDFRRLMEEWRAGRF